MIEMAPTLQWHVCRLHSVVVDAVGVVVPVVAAIVVVVSGTTVLVGDDG